MNKENKDQRKDWLATLKIGDKVFENNYHNFKNLRIVKRITPTGRIVLDCGSREKVFKPNGFSVDGASNSIIGSYLEQWSEEEQIEVNKQKFISFFSRKITEIAYKDMVKIDLDVLVKISILFFGEEAVRNTAEKVGINLPIESE